MENNTAAELQSYILESLKELQSYKDDNETEDLHHELFNQSEYIIGYYQAEQWLIANGGIFNNIEMIKEYEQDNFGECNTDFSNSEVVCNMVAYIYGEEILGSLDCSDSISGMIAELEGAE